MLQIIGGNFGRMSNLQKLRLLLHGDGLGSEDGFAVAQCFQTSLFRFVSLIHIYFLIYLIGFFSGKRPRRPAGPVLIDRSGSWPVVAATAVVMLYS